VKPIAAARRYARALADVAGDRAPVLERLGEDLAVAAAVLDGGPDLRRFFADPSVDARHKGEVIATLVKRARLHELTAGLLRVLAAHGRMGQIGAVAAAFAAIRDQRLGVVEAETTSAVPLTAAEEKRLIESLEKMTGRSVRLRTSVDPGLLGGARTRIGSRVYDGSLRRRLALLRERLAEARW
jgi:F-type H+-transporting ATPase subunit delta